MGEELGMKKRKVIYDEYTGGFYAESKVESLQRQCEYRAKLTDVMNKAEEAKYRTACKQVNAEKNLFLIKKEKDSHRHSEALQEYKAHKNVLEKLAKDRQETLAGLTDIYGRYPPESFGDQIEELIGLELKEMRPVVRRRREATSLLNKRNELTEVDRTMSTEDLFDNIKHRKSRISSPVKTPLRQVRSETPKPPPRLILPAITVKIGNNGNNKVVEPGKNNRYNFSNSSLTTKLTDDEPTLPSVFITDPRSRQGL